MEVDRDLFEEFLSDQAERGSDLEPTEENLNLLTMFAEGSNEDELGAYVSMPDVGFSLAAHSQRPDVAIAMGTYVRPEYREKGWATTFRNSLIDMLVERGYRHIVGMYPLDDDEASIHSLNGFQVNKINDRVFSISLEQDLEQE